MPSGDPADFLSSFSEGCAVVLLKNLLVSKAYQIQQHDSGTGVAHGGSLYNQTCPDAICAVGEAFQLSAVLQTPLVVDMDQQMSVLKTTCVHLSSDGFHPHTKLFWEVLARLFCHQAKGSFIFWQRR